MQQGGMDKLLSSWVQAALVYRLPQVFRVYNTFLVIFSEFATTKQ